MVHTARDYRRADNEASRDQREAEDSIREMKLSKGRRGKRES